MSDWSANHLSISVNGPGGKRHVTLEQPFALLGSHPASDVVLDEPKIAPRSLLLFLSDKGLRGLVVAPFAKKAGRVLRFQPNHPIPLRSYQITVDVVGPHVSQSVSQDEVGVASFMAISWKEATMRRYARLRDGQPFLIGRTQPSHLIINDERLSGVHVCLLPKGRELRVIDLSSTNGTFVAASKIRWATITDKQAFHIGKTRIEVVLLHAEDAVTKQSETTHACAKDVERLGIANEQLENQLRLSVAANDKQRQEIGQLLRTCLAHWHQIRTETEVTRQQRGEHQVEVDGLARENQRLQEAAEHAHRQIQRLEADLAEVSDELVQHHDRVTQTENNLKELQSQAAEAAALSSSYQQEAGDAKQHVHRLETELSEAASETARQHQEAEKAKQELRRVLNELSESDREHARREGEITEIRQQLEEARERNTVYQARYDALADELAKSRTAYDELCQQIENDQALAEQMKKLRDFEESLRQREAELEKVHDDLIVERSVLDNLREHVSSPVQKPQSVVADEDTCISSLDFHDMLEEALEALPPIHERPETS